MPEADPGDAAGTGACTVTTGAETACAAGFASEAKSNADMPTTMRAALEIRKNFPLSSDGNLSWSKTSRYSSGWIEDRSSNSG